MWRYPDQHFIAMRSALRLRIELLPHLYTAARRAFDGGPSPIRPLYHSWPAIDDAYNFPNEYIFGEGNSLVVAPVTSRSPPGQPLARSNIWIPPGHWVLTHSGLRVDGPRALIAPFALDEIPILARAGAVIFGQPPSEVEWEHCSAGTRGTLGRAQRVPLCAQAAIWLPPPPMVGEEGFDESGVGELYEDDGWSDRYAYEPPHYTDDNDAADDPKTSWNGIEPPRAWGAHSSRIKLAWRYGWPYQLRLAIGPSRGCLFRQVAGDANHPRVALDQEPGLPKPNAAEWEPMDTTSHLHRRSEGGGVGRTWRIVLHGLPPPLSATLQLDAASLACTAGESVCPPPQPIVFVSPPEAERRRRSGDRTEPVWVYDAEKLCVVIWLFDLDVATSSEVVLNLDGAKGSAAKLAATVLSPRLRTTDEGATMPTPPLVAMRRSQAAKALLDETYPETQPQDYDQATWLAALGSRLASKPSNFTKEMEAYEQTLKAARSQLEHGEPIRRISAGGKNTERLRNATALVVEAAPSIV